jgi:hypothetical protein
MSPETITIITANGVANSEALERSSSKRESLDSRDLRVPATYPAVLKVTEIEAGIVQDNLKNAVRALRTTFSTTFEQDFGQFQLDEVEVALEVTADGRVGFMGSGVGVKGSSTFKLRFARKQKTD